MTDSSLVITYDDQVVFRGVLKAEGSPPRRKALVDRTNGKLTQLVGWTSRSGRLTLDGIVSAPGDAFAVESDPREDAIPIVRHSVGPSYNLLNRAVYSRDGDWLVSVDVPAGVQITPVAGGDSSRFAVHASGGEITLRFRPRYYQRHRELPHYAPWNYRPWNGSIAGWSSWYAFRDRVTEADIHRTADVLAQQLGPYGLSYLQIDDGYQRTPISVPANWVQANGKFPSGLDSLARYINGRGLQAGIWTNTTFQDDAWAASHPQYFVRAADGTPAWGNWVGYVMDGSQPATMRDLVLPVYRQLKNMGWAYFKVDALRHLRYEGYNSYAAAFARRGLDRVAVYRDFVRQIRTTIGPSAFLLASWGPRPELIGLIDATRLGDDGFGYGGFAQFNSFNNVVWRNDPDHIELAQPDGFRATTLTALTGSVFMLTDKPETYLSPRAEGARRALPIPVTRPGQVYDVDPSRSSRLWMVEHEVSGGGPRPFEADQRLQQTLYQLDVARPFERWTVVARTTGAPDSIPLAQLGLDSARTYLAFDFWAQHFRGAVRSILIGGSIDSLGVQVLCLRPQDDHPQLIATNRHVSCGAVDLAHVRWQDNGLVGRSAVVGDDEYRLYLTEPSGWEAVDVSADGATAHLEPRRDNMRVAVLRATTSRSVTWIVRYRRARA